MTMALALLYLHFDDDKGKVRRKYFFYTKIIDLEMEENIGKVKAVFLIMP